VPSDDPLGAVLAALPAPFVCPDQGSAGFGEIDREQARALLVAVQHRDLGYDQEVMERVVAEALADELVDLMPAPTRWWTNGDVALRRDRAVWTPLTTATFDTGVIGISAPHSMIVWFLDED
jgi:hypothetical protein